MNETALALINARNEGHFLQTIHRLSLGNLNNNKNIENELIYLHNKYLIDVIQEFKALNKSLENIDFLLVCNILMQILPHLNAQILNVINCVNYLIKEFGSDILLYLFYPVLIEFFSKDPSRPNEVMYHIKNSPTSWANFIVPCMISGNEIDCQYYHGEAIKLKDHNDINVREYAILSLGKIKYPENNILLNSTFINLIELVNDETNDKVLSSLIVTIFNLYLIDRSLENKAIDNINKVVSKGSERTFYEAAKLFMNYAAELSENFLSMFRFHLGQMPFKNNDTIMMINCAINKLIRNSKLDEAITFIEYLVLTNNISIELFNTVLHSLERKSLNYIATRWLLQGNDRLCSSLKKIIDLRIDQPIYLEVDSQILTNVEEKRVLFLTKKAIGYLFFNPISAASIIVSLLDHSNKKIANSIEYYLFNPLLISYKGNVQKYLTEVLNSKKGIAKKSIQNVLKKLSNYVKNLKVTNETPELWPDLSKRETYNKYHKTFIVNMCREMQSKSIFSSSATKQIILYGKRAVTFIYHLNGETNRMEIQMQRYSSTIEPPGLEYIDPCGLNYMLITYRSEKLIS